MSIVFQNAIVKKKDFYTWFIQLWKDAGWTDVSSSAASDYQVLMSTGTSGDKEMYMQFRENSSEGVFSTSTGRMIDIRFPHKYTPNASPGTAGTFERTSAPWYRCSIVGINSVSIETPMSIWYNINKNRGVFLFEGNGGYNNVSNFWLFGKPDNELRGETKYSGPIMIYNNCYNNSSVAGLNNNAVLACDDSYLTTTGDIYQTIYLNDYPGPLNTTKKFCSDIVIGSTNGYRYKIDDGILITDSINALSPTIYMVNGNKYKFFYTDAVHSGWGNSLAGYCIGIRIE